MYAQIHQDYRRVLVGIALSIAVVLITWGGLAAALVQ